MQQLSLNTLALCLTILGAAWPILRALNKLNKSIALSLWQHKVMWGWFSHHHKDQIPTYPEIQPSVGARR